MLKKMLSARILTPLLLVSSLSAASTPARLNLVQSSLNFSVATNSNTSTYTVYAFNIGGGTLNLTATSSVPWLVPTVGAETTCGLRGGCYPVSIAFQTGSLAAGNYTGVITLNDPNAVDAPQYFTVNVQVGGDVPDTVNLNLAPGTSATATFNTNGAVATKIANAPWLTATTKPNTASGGFTTTLTATAATGMAPKAYNGTVTVSGSGFSADNKQITVNLNVTTQPIAQASSSAVSFTAAQGSAAQTDNIAVTNAGQGTLTVSSVTATADNSGTWLKAATITGGISVTADPTGLSPDTYTGTVKIASNAVNSSIAIPVQLIVVAQGPPVASVGGVIANSTFAVGEALSQGDIASVYGNQFTFDAPSGATKLPLDTTLGDVQVLVNGVAAPVYYVSSGQINFEIPIDAATANGGAGTVQVVRKGTAGNLVFVQIHAQAPQFIIYNGGYAIMTTPDNALTGIPSHPVKAGDVVTIYAIGLGPTTPVVPSGTASPTKPLATVPGNTQVCFGVVTPFSQPLCAKPSFVGLTPNFVGLYQINVTIPSGIKAGNSTVSVILEDNTASDNALLAVQ
ncbi:MAG TPA: hypothetical protein VFW44_08915 [Bryobacteraceae bacterium]|nr:hypothetical protein [Bryobacteraceae bacterium]